MSHSLKKIKGKKKILFWLVSSKLTTICDVIRMTQEKPTYTCLFCFEDELGVLKLLSENLLYVVLIYISTGDYFYVKFKILVYEIYIIIFLLTEFWILYVLFNFLIDIIPPTKYRLSIPWRALVYELQIYYLNQNIITIRKTI